MAWSLQGGNRMRLLLTTLVCCQGARGSLQPPRPSADLVKAADASPPTEAASADITEGAHLAFLHRAGANRWRHVNLALLEAVGRVALANIAVQSANVETQNAPERLNTEAPSRAVPPPAQLQLVSDLGGLAGRLQAARAREARLREQLLDEAARLQAAERTKGSAVAAAQAASALVRNVAIIIAVVAIACIALGLWSYLSGQRLPVFWRTSSTDVTVETYETQPGTRRHAGVAFAPQPERGGQVAAQVARAPEALEPDAEEEPPSRPPTPDTGGAETRCEYFSFPEDTNPRPEADRATHVVERDGRGQSDGQAVTTAEDAWWEHRSPT